MQNIKIEEIPDPSKLEISETSSQIEEQDSYEYRINSGNQIKREIEDKASPIKPTPIKIDQQWIKGQE